VASVGGTSELWAIGADGGSLEHLAGGSTGYFDPLYLPDGRCVVYGAIAYGGATRGPNIGLWVVRVSPDTSSPLGPPSQITNTGGDRIKNLSLSPDGKTLFYASVRLTGSLHSLPVSKSMEPMGEPVTLTSEVGCREILPALSPDGSRIAFDSCHGRAGVRQQIYVMNADGSDLEQLTFPPETYAYPSWFPDGRRILIEGGGRLVSVDAEARQQKVIATINQNFFGPRISPDGTRAMIDSAVNGIRNIWMVDLASGTAKQFTFDKELAGFGAWSPDGKYIAYEVARSPNDALFIQPSGGGPATQITPFQGQHWMYSWAPDGDKILYAKPGHDLIWNIWSVSRSTKAEKQLTHYTKTNTYVRYPTISPRGNQIVYEFTETTGNIWMMQFK
jgi:Tol biopolymer transport system component